MKGGHARSPDAASVRSVSDLHTAACKEACQQMHGTKVCSQSSPMLHAVLGAAVAAAEESNSNFRTISRVAECACVSVF